VIESTIGRQQPIKATHLPYIGVIVAAVVGSIGTALLSWPFNLIPIGIVVAVIFITLALKFPMFGLYTYLIIFFFKPNEFFPTGAYFPYERLFQLVVVISLALSIAQGKIRLILYRLDWAFLGFCLAVIVSIPTGSDIYRGKLILYNLLDLFLIYLLIVRICRTESNLKAIIWLYVASVMFLSITTINGYYTGDYEIRQGVMRAHSIAGQYASYADPNSLASSLMLGMPFTVVLFKTYRNVFVRVLLISALIVSIWTVVLTGSRSGMVTTIMTLMLIAWHSRHRGMALALASITILVFAALAPHQYVDRFKTIFAIYDAKDEFGAGASARGRINGLVLGIEFMLEKPITGIGAGSFPLEYRKRGGDWSDAHNLIGKLTSELGLVGVFAFSFFIWRYTGYIRSIRERLKKLNWPKGFVYHVRDAVKICLIMLFVQGLFGHNLYRFNWYIFAAFILILSNIVDRYADESNLGDSATKPITVDLDPAVEGT
jgi:putative inorganic carbon (hco3(-)) transporter